MIGKLKMLGALVVATMALAAAPASAAPLFHSEVEHTLGSGAAVGEMVFTVNAGTIKCKKVTGTGTMSAKTTTEVTSFPTFSECTAFGFVNTTIDTNGCWNVITADIEVHLKCPAGQTMVITAFNCWVSVGPQSATSVEYVNTGSGSSRTILAREEGTGIHYVQTSKSFPGCTSGTFTNGTATGEILTKGTNTEGKQVGIWWTDL
jgi:hypothetical protein